MVDVITFFKYNISTYNNSTLTRMRIVLFLMSNLSQTVCNSQEITLRIMVSFAFISHISWDEMVTCALVSCCVSVHRSIC